jgi:hypothetical protein
LRRSEMSVAYCKICKKYVDPEEITEWGTVHESCNNSISWDHSAQVQERFAELEAAIPRWISVEDELPENNGDYLCIYTVDSRQQEPRIFTFYAKRFVVRSDYTEWITHWMPLPAPPVENNDA